MATKKTCVPTEQNEQKMRYPLLWVKSPKKAALASILGNKGTRVLQRAIWQHLKLTKRNALGLPSPCFEDRVPSEEDTWPGAEACADLPLSPAPQGSGDHR